MGLYIDVLSNGFIQIKHLRISYLELVSPLSQDERDMGGGGVGRETIWMEGLLPRLLKLCGQPVPPTISTYCVCYCLYIS